MYIRELTVNEFNEYVSKFPNSNFHQTLNYATLKSDYGYEYELIGYGNEDKLYAAALVLVKLLNGYLYAYIPEGPLMDYDNPGILSDFTESLANYYKKEDIAFIKINPSIVVGEIFENDHFKVKYNNNIALVKTFQECGFTKLNNNMYFESALPRINAILDLEDFNFDKLKKNTKNKIRKGLRRGLTLEKGTSSELNILSEFVKNKKKRNEFYYKDYYNTFSRDDSIDFFLLSIDYAAYYESTKYVYEKELKKNEDLALKVEQNPVARNINKKINSDKNLLIYKKDLSLASKEINKSEKTYIAAALVIKHKDCVTLSIYGYDRKYQEFAPNYYLIYAIANHYKGKYKYFNLNGLAADFSKNSKYFGLNEFKLGFKPHIYEYIGEFDLVLNYHIYNRLIKKNLLDKEFNN